MAVRYIANRGLLVNGRTIRKGKEVRGIKKRNLKALINTGRIRVEEVEEDKIDEKGQEDGEDDLEL